MSNNKKKEKDSETDSTKDEQHMENKYKMLHRNKSLLIFAIAHW